LGSKPEKTYLWGAVFILYVSLALGWGEVSVVVYHDYDSFENIEGLVYLKEKAKRWDSYLLAEDSRLSDEGLSPAFPLNLLKIRKPTVNFVSKEQEQRKV